MSRPTQWAQRRRHGFESGFRRFFGPLSVICIVLSGCTIQELPEEDQARQASGNPQLIPVPPGSADSADSAGVAAEIAEMLHASTRSWNAGDLDGFLDDYWQSEALTFSGSSGVTRGWEGVRDRYRESYWAPGAQRDSLRFEALEIMPLGQTHALALGQYVLYRPEEEGRITNTGFFSLVLWKVDGAWKIVHDHTSAASAP